jgi:hypothetical protein
MTDSTSIPKELRQQLPKHLAAYIIGLLGLTGIGLLQVYGDSVFDSVHHALGSKMLLQLGVILLSALGYCIYALVHKHHPTLLRHRALYWAGGDRTPFCAFCYETAQKRLHLVGPTVMPAAHKDVERWECPVCYHCYVSKSGEDFILHETRGVGACVG